MYTLMVNVWTRDMTDYISGYYNGEKFNTKDEAEKALKEAKEKYKEDPTVELSICKIGE